MAIIRISGGSSGIEKYLKPENKTEQEVGHDIFRNKYSHMLVPNINSPAGRAVNPRKAYDRNIQQFNLTAEQFIEDLKK